jgi:hypothetical protein
MKGRLLSAIRGTTNPKTKTAYVSVQLYRPTRLPQPVKKSIQVDFPPLDTSKVRVWRPPQREVATWHLFATVPERHDAHLSQVMICSTVQKNKLLAEPAPHRSTGPHRSTTYACITNCLVRTTCASCLELTERLFRSTLNDLLPVTACL